MKLFVVPISFKLFIHCVMGVVALSGAALASEMQVTSLRERPTLDLMSPGKSMSNCFPCELCCPAAPSSTRASGNDEQPNVAITYLIPSFNSVVRSMLPYFWGARFDVVLRILYCCWRN